MVLEPGRLIFEGIVGRAHAHAHAAAQLLVVTAGDVEVVDGRGEARAIQAALIPARAVHAVHGEGAKAVFVYCDPDSSQGRALQARFASVSRDRVTDWIAAAAPACSAQVLGADEAGEAALRAVTGSRPTRACHPALCDAAALVHACLGCPIRLSDVAAEVGLSAGRLGHLFAEEFGLSFPAYVRWARLRRTIELARGGASLTQAAHGAGFADSSHLTRVVHEMFGLAPSEILHSVQWAPPANMHAHVT
ncbi:AraC family transcriptional regulator [Streptomyces labedae]|uniref:AraC family transcriptional regulator n=1 Tax=Streptomyces labedae TaxID=285569 RepID=A0ABP6QPS8_9ACTN